MQQGIVLTTGDARTQVELAVAAEAAGWDAVFTYDAISIGDSELHDPWVLLGAIAARTSRVRLGALVFAPSRRRPWKLAKEAFTVDQLSGGRLVLPVGLGALDDLGYANVGEATPARERAGRLDETLAILDGLSTGEPFAFAGEHYGFGPMRLHPLPVQQPRIPVWVVGAWPHERSMRRAARWDGLVVQVPEEGGTALGDVVEWVRRERAELGLEGPFEIVRDGVTALDDAGAAQETLRRAEAAGVTWWIEADWQAPALDALRARIEAGPVRA